MSESSKTSALSRDELLKLAKETARAFGEANLANLYAALDSADVAGLLGVLRVFENAEAKKREELRAMN